MLTYQDLKRKQQAAADEARKLIDKAEAEHREPTEDEQKQIDAQLAESQRCGRLAANLLKVDGAEEAARQGTPASPPADVTRDAGVPMTPATARDRDAERWGGWNPRCALGEIGSAILRAGPRGDGHRDPRLFATASGMSVGGDGAFVLPAAVAQTIWDGMAKEYDNLIPLTDSYPMSENGVVFPAIDETSRTSGNLFGGCVAYWRAEATQMTNTLRPKLRDATLRANHLYAMSYVTNELMRSNNVVALNQFLNRSAQYVIGFKLSDAVWEGDGVGKPLGIMTALASTSKGPTVSVAKESGQAAATVVVENIAKMWARLHARARANAKWYINQEVEAQLNQMTMGIGTAGVPVYMPPGGISQAPYGTIYGKPVVPIEYASALGTQGDILVGDLKFYLTGIASGVDYAESIHLRFDYGETAFKWEFYADGQPWLLSPITPFKATSGKTLAPFVTLDTRA